MAVCRFKMESIDEDFESKLRQIEGAYWNGFFFTLHGTAFQAKLPARLGAIPRIVPVPPLVSNRWDRKRQAVDQSLALWEELEK